MKILLITDGIYPFVTGGMQKHSFYLLKYLLKSEINVLLYHCTKPENKGELGKELGEVNLDYLEEVIIPFPKVGGMFDGYLRSSMAYSRSIMAGLKQKGDVDYIYAQGFTPWALVDAKKRGEAMAPISVNFHGLEMFQYARGFKSKVIQYLFKGPVKFISQHADISYSLGGKLTDILTSITDKEKVRVIPIGLEESWLRDVNDISGSKETLNVAFIGRYERRKGVEELNEVMSRMSDDSVHFHLIGPIPDSKKNTSSSVTYYGLVKQESEIKDILDACDVLVVPSMSEGMPTVILEAMARGLAIIASDVGAVASEVSDDNGWLIEAGNAQQLYAYLRAAMELDSDSLKQMKIRSRHKVEENFLWTRIINLTIDQIHDDLKRLAR
jgi:glycosyltransferase involved in cell wall biosynthesis